MKKNDGQKIESVNAEQFSKRGKSALKSGKGAKKSKQVKTAAQKRRTAFLVVGIVAVVVIVLGIFVGSAIGRLTNPDVVFQHTPAPLEPGATRHPDQTLAPGETPPPPTIDPVLALEEQSDNSIVSGDFINIMLIGVDYEEIRYTGEMRGKDGNAFHSDVMMVLAVNLKENRADLISFPRDTYAKIPGVKGIYKMNASLNCGRNENDKFGFFPELNNEGPFRKVCDTAEWMLGAPKTGIKIDYYYAVTMPSFKKVVDAVGPIWYDVEGKFDNGGRYYQAGEQWMDGQAVLDYVRVRKPGHGSLPTGDQARADRQRRMMVAILDHMKSAGTIFKLPELMRAFMDEEGNSQLYTNVTTEQTAALALFAYRYLSDGNIGMHSMGGAARNIFHWNFCLTDQKNRVNIIKKVYGIDADQYNGYSVSGAETEWADMLKPRYVENTKKVLDHVQKLLDEDDKLPEFSPSPSPSASATPAVTPTPAGATPAPVTNPPTDPPTAPPGDSTESFDFPSTRLFAPAAGTRQYTPAQRQMVKDLRTLYDSVRNTKHPSLIKLGELQQKAIAVAKEFKYTAGNIQTPSYTNAVAASNSPWAYKYYDTGFNQVKVNFN
ncbi:MAG: LCP family protein [Clostridiales bacterium]|nr:LCP family protein [Clostridiales bacterium]